MMESGLEHAVRIIQTRLSKSVVISQYVFFIASRARMIQNDQMLAMLLIVT
jgi:hypothetical protein